MAEREVRYCTTEDGVRIAYCVEGEGPPLLMCPILFESFSVDHLLTNYQRFMQAIAGQCTLIRYDTQGTGLSQRDVSGFSPQGLVCDIEAVVRAVGVDRLSICGVAGSGPRAISYAAENPDRVKHLILLWSYSRGLDLLPRPVFDSLVDLIRTDWRLGARAVADLGTRDIVEVASKLEEMYVQSATADAAVALLKTTIEEDETANLSRVTCPVLVMQPTDNRFFTMEMTRGIASRLPDSHLMLVDQKTVNFFGDNWSPIVEAISRFVGTREYHGEASTSSAAFRTVLFTDLVGHTEMMQRLGDARGREVLREHERITREVIKQHGGNEIKTDGDSFMVSFVSVSRALECAVALQRAFAEYSKSAKEPIIVRMGLHAGEPIAEDGDLFGSSVILAARIAAQADGGEILASNVVRELCSGKPFLFADRGEHAMRGFDEAVRVFEVRWRA